MTLQDCFLFDFIQISYRSPLMYGSYDECPLLSSRSWVGPFGKMTKIRTSVMEFESDGPILKPHDGLREQL